VDQAAAIGTNRALDVLAIMSRLVEGEILIAEGKLAEGIDALKAAAHAEDQLGYDEPPAWIQPTRHALGAALLRARDGVHAEAVFREDLRRHPDNGWALWGLARALGLQGKNDGPDGARAIFRRFTAAWTDADISLSSSCMCLPGV
jgi:predicted Zn-dependent protease